MLKNRRAMPSHMSTGSLTGTSTTASASAASSPEQPSGANGRTSAAEQGRRSDFMWFLIDLFAHIHLLNMTWNPPKCKIAISASTRKITFGRPLFQVLCYIYIGGEGPVAFRSIPAIPDQHFRGLCLKV